ncbi:unnamed protein product [Heterobilharzia americana]|nr:unnamed protein product [Heterobilharzia americana]
MKILERKNMQNHPPEKKYNRRNSTKKSNAGYHIYSPTSNMNADVMRSTLQDSQVITGLLGLHSCRDHDVMLLKGIKLQDGRRTDTLDICVLRRIEFVSSIASSA